MLWLGMLIGLIAFVSGCDPAVTNGDTAPDAPTATRRYLATVVNPIPPSATIAAQVTLPTANPGGNIGAQDFTPGAPPVLGDNGAATSTPLALPTQAAIPMYVPAVGAALAATYYTAAHSPAPAVLLVPGVDETRQGWGNLPAQMQAAGFIVLTVDLRGYGDTGGSPDWKQAPADVQAAFDLLRTLSGVDPTRLSIGGSGIGANLAAVTCAAASTCAGVVLISPSATDQGIATGDALKTFGSARHVFIATSVDDDPSAIDSGKLDSLLQGAHRLQRFDGRAHGLALLAVHPELGQTIIAWLKG